MSGIDNLQQQQQQQHRNQQEGQHNLQGTKIIIRVLSILTS
jgi:hypothetical protein